MATGKVISATAVAVKVTHVTSPSSMLLYHEDSYAERLQRIGEKLQILMKNNRWKKKASAIQPQTGDIVVIRNRVELDLPAWWSRGELVNYDSAESNFLVLLVDHGYYIKVAAQDVTVIPDGSLDERFLSIRVALKNLIPVEYPPRVSSDKTKILTLRTIWSEMAVDTTRELIASAAKLYFEAANNDAEYGNMYLLLDNEILSLSKLLVYSDLAIYMTRESSSLIQKLYEEKRTRVVDDQEAATFVAVAAKSIEPTDTLKNCYVGQDERVSPTRARGGKFNRYAGEECLQILVRSNVNCECLMTIADARFPPRIHRVLEKNLSIIALRKIQSYMWPAVTKGLNVVAVGSPDCGKTIGYVLPVVSGIASAKKIPEGNSPSILILCSSTSDVLSVQSLCAELLEDYTDIRCVAGYNGREDRSLVANIYNGCQIFVATPPFIVRFLNQDKAHKKVLNFRNLSCLVIDGIDTVLAKYYEEFKNLCRQYVPIGEKERRDVGLPALQIVAAARKWSPNMSKFASLCMTDPYICIGSYMEAAVFGCVMPKLHFFPSDKKMEKFAELLDDNVTMTKTIVICTHSEEARALDEYLSKTKKTLVACERMIFTEIRGVRECWKASISGLYPVLICTDQVLVDLNITDVDWLIHYSVALPTKTQFYSRFSTMMINLKKGEGKCKMTIVVDEKNEVQLYGVVDVVSRCGTKLSTRFLDNVKRIVTTLDMRKEKYPICDNVKAFGTCPKQYSCPYRHCILNGIDTPSTPIAIGDSVKLTVTFVHNATHFTARLMEYIRPDRTVTEYSAEEYTRTSAIVHNYYADKSHRRYRQENIQVGDFFALEESIDNFKRVKVLNIVEKDYDEIPIAVQLKCIDSGAILPRIKVTQLMELPEELLNRETHIVEVFLAGLSPYDAEDEWNHRAANYAHTWFPDQTKPYSYVLGKVRLHLADTLWVDPLEIRTKIIGYPDMVSSSLKSKMIRLGHGVANETHLPALFNLCKIGAVKTPDGKAIEPETVDSRDIAEDVES